MEPTVLKQRPPPFFLPAATEATEAARVYRNIARFVSAPATGRRVFALSWQHNAMDMRCEVGAPLPPYFGTGADPVVAIFECEHVYKTTTAGLGVLRGEPVLAASGGRTQAEYFSE